MTANENANEQLVHDSSMAAATAIVCITTTINRLTFSLTLTITICAKVVVVVADEELVVTGGKKRRVVSLIERKPPFGKCKV